MVKPTPHDVLAENMRALRRERGWSQEHLAAESRLHRTYIGAVERRERNPSVKSLERIATAFGLEVWQLLKPPISEASGPSEPD